VRQRLDAVEGGQALEGGVGEVDCGRSLGHAKRERRNVLLALGVTNLAKHDVVNQLVEGQRVVAREQLDGGADDRLELAVGGVERCRDTGERQAARRVQVGAPQPVPAFKRGMKSQTAQTIVSSGCVSASV
jgi:hypothetical protein